MLMVVAKPWMSESPAPSMSHSEGSVPGLLFSQATGFPPGPQGSLAANAAVGTPKKATTSAMTTARMPPRPNVPKLGAKRARRRLLPHHAPKPFWDRTAATSIIIADLPKPRARPLAAADTPNDTKGKGSVKDRMPDSLFLAKSAQECPNGGWALTHTDLADGVCRRRAGTCPGPTSEPGRAPADPPSPTEPDPQDDRGSAGYPDRNETPRSGTSHPS